MINQSLPSSWKWTNLRAICSVHPGQHILSTDYNVQRLGIGYITGPSDFGELYPTVTRWTEEPKAFCLSTDVLVTVKGAGVGKLNLAPKETVAIGRQLMAIRPKSGVADQLYLYYALSTRFLELQTAALGSTVPGLSRKDLEQLKIPLPPLSEQQRIAAIIDEQMQAVEEARRAAEAELSAAEELKAAYLREVFESEEAQGWDKFRLGDIAATTSGTTPLRSRSDYYEEGSICWVKTGELKDGMIYETEERITELALRETSLKLLPPETLLVAMYGQGQTRGRTGLLKVTATTNQACFAILPKPNIFDTKYLQLWFQHSYKRLRTETEGRGGNQPNLNGQVLNEQYIPLPPLDVQKRIVTALDHQKHEIDYVYVTLEHQLDLIGQLPATILVRAFNGGY